MLLAWGWANDGDEISRSRGNKGGIVVLYPRVVPDTEDAQTHALARKAQDQLSRIAESIPGAPEVERRGFPERSCPVVGCKALSVGLLLAHRDGGCVGVVLVNAPGASATQLVPWLGQVTLVVPEAPWRVPPESEVIVVEFASCDRMWESVSDEAVRQAIVTRWVAP